MLKEFREFMMRGNVLDLAVAVVIGGAFGKIVTSLVNDIIMPPLGLILGHVEFSSLFIDLSGGHHATLADAKAAAAPTINYGLFIDAIVQFLIVALAIFLVVRVANKLQKVGQPPAAPVEPSTKDCPFCLLAVPINARRCAHCTSELAA